MIMKRHILAALREQLEQWERALARLDEAQLAAVHPSDGRSIKDDLAHLWAWQQRTAARVEGAVHDRPPALPKWPEEIDLNTEDGTDQANEWIYAGNRDRPYSEIYANWRSNFLRVLELAEQVSERDLLDNERYPWLNGNALALYLLGTYDHHQEHVEKALTARKS